MMPTDAVSATFAALSDPTRRAILERLASGEASVSELAEPFDISLPAITKHLKVLEHAGLITRSRHAQWRPCKLEAKPLQEASGWIERYRPFWEESFDRLDAYLQELQSETGGAGNGELETERNGTGQTETAPGKAQPKASRADGNRARRPKRK